MSFQDKSLQCSDCGNTFTFTVTEQEYFHTRGYTNSPKRCLACRETRQSKQRTGSSYMPKREMFPATCAECGRDTKVPFEPLSGRPVYCSECYNKVRVSR
jgi:CxxC-x17-CxxC domain-containing protein